MTKPKLTKTERAALNVLACPVGGWPETEQAWARLVDVGGQYASDGRIVAPDLDEAVARALRKGASLPLRAEEWGWSAARAAAVRQLAEALVGGAVETDRSRCDRCGETVTDLDAGFSPGLHAMTHACGGTWRRMAGRRP